MPHIVIKLLNDAGFDLQEYVTLNRWTEWPKPPLTYRYPLRVMHYLCMKLIEAFDGSACGMGYRMIAQLKS